MDVWLAFLVVFAGLMLLAAVAGAVARSSLRKALPPVPTTAIEEARRTIDVLKTRNGRGG